MRSKLSLLVLLSFSSLALACGGGGECAQAFDKELECNDFSDEEKAEMKGDRKAAVAACNADKDHPRMKQAIKCGKTKSCEEFKSCKLEARSKDDIEAIKKALAAGDPKEAVSECSYSLDTYKAVPDFKAACEGAYTAFFKDIKGEDAISDARYRCASSSDFKEWMAASPAFKAGCTALLDQLKTAVTTQRDSGSEYDYSTCSSYKDMVAALNEADVAASEMLCNEADQADDFTKSMAEAKKALADKSGTPYGCKSFLDDKDKFVGSEWFAGKAAELAKVCFSDLGKIALAGVTSYCPMDAKDTHKFAAEYKLADADAELKALLEGTLDKCKE